MKEMMRTTPMSGDRWRGEAEGAGDLAGIEATVDSAVDFLAKIVFAY
jgi:hypothetical protein